MSTAVTNRYLAGNFGPVGEEVTAIDLPVSGHLPDVLSGRYLRNGPNPVVPPDPARYHWFTGDAMVHGVRLRDGRAEWYRNRWVRSATVAEALGEPARPGPVHAGMDISPNTNVISHAGRTFAIIEAGPRPYELTYDLDTVGPSDFAGTLPGGYAAHPKRDPATGELHAVAYFWGWDYAQYIVIGTDGGVVRTEDIAVTGRPMMHDFSLTQSSVVIYDLPVTFNTDAATAGSTFPYEWEDDYRARVGVMPRAGTAADVRWFDVEPCFVFHPMNAYDDGDRIVLDVVRHPKMFASDRLGPNDGTPTLERWTIDVRRDTITEERLDDRGQEFPRVDERVVSRRHRFGYSAAATMIDGSVDLAGSALLKHDLDRRTAQTHDFGRGAAVSEAVFVPAGPDAVEDDGYVLSLVFEPDRQATDLVVIAAQDFSGPPVARVHLPVRVPFGFHGNWLADGPSL